MLKKILKYIIAAAIACYLIFALVIVPSRKDNDKCREVAIKISNNRLGTITNDDIVAMLQEEGLCPQDKVMDSINCHDIENFINGMTIVKECQVYKTNEKRVKIDVICREPVLKVYDNSGNTYYVDIDGEKICDVNKPLLLPVASGEIDDSMIKKELLDIVSAIADDPFWLAQIEQIYFNEKKEAIITPRMGSHVIELGNIKNIEEKLENIKVFYTKGLNIVGWDKYSKLNIKISNKVICTEK